MTCTVGYFFSGNERNAGNSYCAFATCDLFGRVYLRSSLKIVKKSLIDIEINLALPFVVRSVYRVRKSYRGPLILNDLDPSTHGFHHLILAIVGESQMTLQHGFHMVQV